VSLRTDMNSHFRRGAYLAAGLLVAFLGATTWSYRYWGYCFRPPSVSAYCEDIASVVSITKYSRHSRQAGFEPLLPRRELAWAYEHASPPLFPEHPEFRLLHALDKSSTSLLPDQPDAMHVDAASAIVDELQIEAEFGHGLIVDARDRQGAQIILFSGSTFPTDHRKYCEVVAKASSDGSLRRISSTSFNFDSAGLEGVGWLTIFLIVSAILLFLALCMSGLAHAVLIIRKRRER